MYSKQRGSVDGCVEHLFSNAHIFRPRTDIDEGVVVLDSKMGLKHSFFRIAETF